MSGFSFGATNTSTPAQGFSSTPAPSTNAFGQSNTGGGGGGLFGNTNTTSTNTFGAAPATTATGGTSLFGNTGSTAAPSGGLFGSTTNNTTQQSNPFGATTGTTSLFGGQSQPAASTAPTGSIFGNTAFNTTSNINTGGGLFGGGGGFGGTQQTQSTFGTSTISGGGLFGGGGLNAQSQQQQVLQPAQPKLDPKSTFADLPAEVGDALKQIELKMNAMSRVLESINQDLKQTADDAKVLGTKRDSAKQKVTALFHEVKMDDEIISTVNEQKARDLAIAAQCERENKNERYDTYHSKRVGSFDGYLMQVMMNALHRMQDYQNYIVDLERDMESVKGQRRFSPDVLQKIMRDQHDAYQALSSKVSSLHQLVEGIREDWTEYVLRNELSNDPVAERRKKSGRPGMLVGAGGGDFNSDKRPGMGPKANSGFDITKLVTMGTVAPGIAGAPGTANLSTGTTTGGGLFGGGFNASKPAFGATTQPATSGFGGFGMAASTPLKSTTGGLFGSSMTTANTGLGGFGQSTTNTTAPSATGFAGFGAASKPAATPSTATFSGFTSTAQPASTGGFSGFGSTATQPAASGFSGFTASKPAAPASQPFTLNTNSSNTTGGGFSFGK